MSSAVLRCPSCARTFLRGSEGLCPHDGGALEPMSARDPREGLVLAGRYRLERRLDEGGMGVVYLAVQISVGREVAVKLLHPARARDTQAVMRFLREAHAVSRIDSPHVVTLIDFGETETGELFLVMELLRGESLAHRLLREGPLPVALACKVLGDVARALAEAHAHAIVHRDLKPANIFLVDTPGYAVFAKVLDFGVAAVIGPTDAGHGLTDSQSVPGTPHYLAPETSGTAPAIPASDVYALGIIAWEILFGRPPFDGATAFEILVQHAARDLPAWGTDVTGAPIPEPLRRFIARCLAKSPALRPADGNAAARALAAALDGIPLAGADNTTSSALESPRPTSPAVSKLPEVQARRHWPFVTAFIALVLGLLGAAISLPASSAPTSIPSRAAAALARHGALPSAPRLTAAHERDTWTLAPSIVAAPDDGSPTPSSALPGANAAGDADAAPRRARPLPKAPATDPPPAPSERPLVDHSPLTPEERARLQRLLD